LQKNQYLSARYIPNGLEKATHRSSLALFFTEL